MLRITLKLSKTTKGSLTKQFKFFRELGVSRLNSFNLLCLIRAKRTVMIQTMTNLKPVSARFSRVESDAYSVGFDRDVYNVGTKLYNIERFRFVQNLKLKPYYENTDAKIYVSRQPE